MNKKTKPLNETEQCAADFGEQWTAYPENEGEYAQLSTLQDIFGDLLSIEEIEGKSIVEIGSGSGRIVNMLLDAGAKIVTALEPSAAFAVLKQNTEARSDRVIYLQEYGGGGALPKATFDLAFSIGVIHHIPDPAATLAEMRESLKDGGRALIWLYGREGNGLYLFFIKPLRLLTKRLPHKALQTLCKILAKILDLYLLACRFLPLPMRRYMLNVIAKWTPHTRFVTIYDQLNPAYAKYYKKEEAIALMQNAGFTNLRIFHRHGYSWSVIGQKSGGGVD